jgi:drug/metabolite transporter (DMT)-like permease
MTLAYMAPSGIFALIFLRPELPARLHSLPLGFWFASAGLVLFCTVFAHLLWFRSLQRIEAGQAAISTYIIPIFSLAYARLWLGESIRLTTIVAAVAIIAGIVIAEYGNFRKSRPEIVREPH